MNRSSDGYRSSKSKQTKNKINEKYEAITKRFQCLRIELLLLLFGTKNIVCCFVEDVERC